MDEETRGELILIELTPTRYNEKGKGTDKITLHAVCPWCNHLFHDLESTHGGGLLKCWKLHRATCPSNTKYRTRKEGRDANQA